MMMMKYTEPIVYIRALKINEPMATSTGCNGILS